MPPGRAKTSLGKMTPAARSRSTSERMSPRIRSIRFDPRARIDVRHAWEVPPGSSDDSATGGGSRVSHRSGSRPKRNAFSTGSTDMPSSIASWLLEVLEKCSASVSEAGYVLDASLGQSARRHRPGAWRHTGEGPRVRSARRLSQVGYGALCGLAITAGHGSIRGHRDRTQRANGKRWMRSTSMSRYVSTT